MKWRHDDWDPPPEPEDRESLPPEEQEDWDIPPLREKLTRLACGD